MSLRKKRKRTRNKMSMFSEQAFIVQESALILKELKEALWIGRSTRWETEKLNYRCTIVNKND